MVLGNWVPFHGVLGVIESFFVRKYQTSGDFCYIESIIFTMRKQHRAADAPLVQEMTAAENRTEDRMFHLFSDQLHSITEHLALLNKTPFDQAQYLLQTEALIRDLQSAQTYFSELQRWQIFKELILVHGTTLENVSQDYQLVVLQSRISGLARHVPDDKDIYRLQLRKLSEEGEKLKDLSKQLIQLFSKYYLSPHDGSKGEAR